MKNSEKVVVVTRIDPSIANKLDRIISASSVKMNRTLLLEKLICLYVSDNAIDDDVDEKVDIDPAHPPIIPPVNSPLPPAAITEIDDVDIGDCDPFGITDGTLEFCSLRG